jgi:tRNA threonylcarbamoyladenosine biosynthesis protein TsaB
LRILAIETSSKSVSVALLEKTDLILELDSKLESPDLVPGRTQQNAGFNDQLPAGYVRKRAKRGNKTSRIFPPGASVLLAPMIKSVFQQTGLPIGSVELIAVSTGPGSFTGLRVGVVTAKALAYSNQAHVIGVNTLEVIAAQTAPAMAADSYASQPKRICPVVNAQRQQVFAGYYLASGTLLDRNWRIDEETPNEILDRETWLKQIRPGDVLTGPGLVDVVPEQDAPNPDYVVAPKNYWTCTANYVGKLAWRQFEGGKRDSLWDLEPSYFRPSAAEEVRSAKIKRAELD